MVVAAIFAALCLSVAISGFSSLGSITDPAQASDARGFAWFWAFLASIAIGFSLLSWWLTRVPSEGDDA